MTNISNTILVLPNGTLWFPPFKKLITQVHRGKFQCVAKLRLHNRAILSNIASVNGGELVRKILSLVAAAFDKKYPFLTFGAVYLLRRLSSCRPVNKGNHTSSPQPLSCQNEGRVNGAVGC